MLRQLFGCLVSSPSFKTLDEAFTSVTLMARAKVSFGIQTIVTSGVLVKCTVEEEHLVIRESPQGSKRWILLSPSHLTHVHVVGHGMVEGDTDVMLIKVKGDGVVNVRSKNVLRVTVEGRGMVKFGTAEQCVVNVSGGGHVHAVTHDPSLIVQEQMDGTIEV